MERKFIISIHSESMPEVNLEVNAESETDALARAWKLMRNRDVRYMTAKSIYSIVFTTAYGLRKERIVAESAEDAVAECARRGFNTHEIWSINRVMA